MLTLVNERTAATACGGRSMVPPGLGQTAGTQESTARRQSRDTLRHWARDQPQLRLSETALATRCPARKPGNWAQGFGTSSRCMSGQAKRGSDQGGKAGRRHKIIKVIFLIFPLISAVLLPPSIHIRDQAQTATMASSQAAPKQAGENPSSA